MQAFFQGRLQRLNRFGSGDLPLMYVRHKSARLYVGRGGRDDHAIDSVRAKLPPLYVLVSPVARPA